MWTCSAKCGEKKSHGRISPHEANFLKLDCSKIKTVFSWRPRLHVSEAVAHTVEWTKEWLGGNDVSICMDRQIIEFLKLEAQ